MQRWEVTKRLSVPRQYVQRVSSLIKTVSCEREEIVETMERYGYTCVRACVYVDKFVSI